MRMEISVERERECYSLIPDIRFATVPAWFGATKRELKMDILAPKFCEGHTRLPAIVWICGGSFYTMDKAVWIPQLVHLAERGYVICSVSYRTSNEAAFPAPLMDIKSAIRYLRAHAADYAIDPDRIAVMGESAGGTLAALAGVTGNCPEYEQGEYLAYSSSVQAIVDFYGITDMPSILGQIRAIAGQMEVPWLLDAFLGVRCTEKTMEKASAISYAAPDLPPVLILHGSADRTVPVEQSVLFYEALTKAGATASFYLLEGAVHGDDLFYQDEVLDRIDDTLRLWMKKAVQAG